MLAALQEPPDGDLVHRARQGDAEAYGELVRRYQSAVFNVCYRLLGERRSAEDLAQEAFIRAYGRLDTFDVGRPFGPWMRRLAANLCLNHVARHAPPAVALDDEVAPDLAHPLLPGADPEAMAEANATALAVRAAILALPARYRAVIELRHYQELSYAEMAETLGRPLSDIKSDLFRARKLLADVLKREGVMDD